MTACITCGHSSRAHIRDVAGQLHGCVIPGCNCTTFEEVPATTPGVWEQVDGALQRLGPGALSPEAQQQVERVMATTPTAVAGPAPDPAWDDGFADAPEPPLHERVPWRIGVLDKDLFESPRDVEAHSLLVAGWYVRDCAGLLEQLQAAQDDKESLAITWNDECQNLRGRLQAAQAENQQLRDLLNELWLRQPSGGQCADLWEQVHNVLEHQAALGQVDQ